MWDWFKEAEPVEVVIAMIIVGFMTSLIVGMVRDAAIDVVRAAQCVEVE